MIAAVAHRGPDGHDVRRAGPVAIGHQHLWITLEEIGERQPLVGDRGAIVAFDGRLDNREEVLRRLDLPAAASDAAAVLAAYGEWSDAFVDALVGDFAVAIFDPASQRLILARDALGVRPLYYHDSTRVIAFASEIKALLAHPDIPAIPDDDGVADALMIRVRPVDGLAVTCFAGVAALEPAHVLVATQTETKRRRYWDFDGGTRLQLKSFADYADAFRERFAASVRRRLRSAFPVAVSVSGGLDSSSIFCQAAALGRRESGPASEIVGISYVTAGGTADEREYLQAIETQYGLPITRVPLVDHLGVVEGARGQLWHVEVPSLDYLWQARVAIGRTMREHGARVLLSGHWGDQVLFSTGYLVDLARRLSWSEAVRHLREFHHWLDAGEAREYARRLMPEVARSYVPEQLRAPLKRLRRRWSEAEARPWFTASFVERARRGSEAPVRLGQRFHSVHARRLYLEARSAYHVQCMEWNNKAAAMDGQDHAFPFLDRDLVSLLVATPGTMQNFGGVPRAILREAMRGVLPDAVRARTWKADFSEAVNEGVARDYSAIASHLTRDGQAVARGYFDATALERDVARLASPRPSTDSRDSWDLTDAFGFELWLRVFFAHDTPIPPGRAAS